MRVVLIDDESRARNSLKILLMRLGMNISVVGEASDIPEGIELVKDCQPDVVFLDIEMPPYNGFDLLDHFPDRAFKVIFVTAYHEYALDAIRQRALHYILKPILLEDLVEAIDRVNSYMVKPKQPTIKIKNVNGENYVAVHSILRCESFKNYTTLYFLEGGKTVMSKTLKEYEELLAPHGFIRVHHSHLVNVEHVLGVEQGDVVRMVNGDGVTVSRRKKEFVVTQLDLAKGIKKG